MAFYEIASVPRRWLAIVLKPSLRLATPRAGDQVVMPTPRGCRLPPSHQGEGALSIMMVSDGVGGYHGRAELGLFCGRDQGT
jgi:hypothetical protein